MAKKVTAKQISRNIVISLSAQGIAFLSSIVLNLLVPKFISELQYSLWQTYILYSGYVGLFHFGLLDGIVLRYSKYDYDELDKVKMCSQFRTLLAFLGISSAVIFVVLNCENNVIGMFVCVGIITKNIYTYTTYLLQITNRINKYAVTVIIQKVFYIIFVVFLLLSGIQQFYYFCLVDLGADITGAIVGARYNRGLYLKYKGKLHESLQEAFANVKSGMKLMFANLSANFLIGSAKMAVQWHWGVLVFGKISFSFSISNIFLTFISAISVVMFPSLKRTDKEQLGKLYIDIRTIMTWGMIVMMIMYYPAAYILQLWLPAYSESLYYLGILLPTVIFLSRISLLTNNYLKVLRKENNMLVINAVSVLAGMCLFFFGSYVLDKLSFVLFFIVLTIVVRSVISEIVVVKLLEVKIMKDVICELVITILFISLTTVGDLVSGALGYLVVVVIYTCYNKNIIYFITKVVKNKPFGK